MLSRQQFSLAHPTRVLPAYIASVGSPFFWPSGSFRLVHPPFNATAGIALVRFTRISTRAIMLSENLASFSLPLGRKLIFLWNEPLASYPFFLPRMGSPSNYPTSLFFKCFCVFFPECVATLMKSSSSEYAIFAVDLADLTRRLSRSPPLSRSGQPRVFFFFVLPSLDKL